MVKSVRVQKKQVDFERCHELGARGHHGAQDQRHRLPDLLWRGLSLTNSVQHQREHHGDLLAPAGQEA